MGALLPSEGNQTALSRQEKQLLQDDVQWYTVLHLRKILSAEIKQILTNKYRLFDTNIYFYFLNCPRKIIFH